MSKQEAIEHFNKGNLVESEKIFKQEVLNSDNDLDKILCLEYLVQIYSKTNSSFLLDSQRDLFQLYVENKKSEALIREYKKINNPDIQFKKMYLEALWEIKDISKFDEEAQNVCEQILTEKIYVLGKEVILWLKEVRKWMLYPKISTFLFYIGLGNEKEALEEVLAIEDLLCSKWSKIEVKKKNQKEYLYHLDDLVQKVENNSAEFQAYKRLSKVKTKLLKEEDRTFSKKDLLSLLIYNHFNPNNLTFLIPFLPSEEAKGLLVEYIKTFNKKGLIAPGSPYVSLIDYFTIKRKVNIVRNSDKQYYPTSYNVEGVEDVYDERIFDEYLKNEKDEIEKDEVFFKGLIRHEAPGILEEKESLVIALMELGLFDSSKMLLDKIESELNREYLRCEILYKEESYTDVIAIVNEVIVDYDLTAYERIPFYYLKANAYLKLNKDVEAQNLFSIINTLNPDYRSLRERILND